MKQSAVAVIEELRLQPHKEEVGSKDLRIGSNGRAFSAGTVLAEPPSFIS